MRRPVSATLGALDTDISILERCVSESLLENGIEDQPKASAGDLALCISNARSEITKLIALRQWTTLFLCQLAVNEGE